MRTELLCALALLCGAEVAYGQYGPANTYYYNGYYYNGYSPGYAYPYGNNTYNNAYNPYAAQPRAYYYPSYPAASYPSATPRYSTVALPSQSSGSVVQATPIEVVPEVPPTVPPAPVEVIPLPEASPRLIQHPADDGPAKVNLREYLSNKVNLGEYLSSIWPAPVAYHRSPNDQFWVSGEYLQGWIRPGPLNAPLVTSGLASDSPAAAAIGQPGTAVLFGGNINFPTTPGVHLEAGCFVDDANRVSLELGGLVYAPTTSRLNVASDGGGNPVIGRPFFNTNTQTEQAVVNSLPGSYTGSATVNAYSQLWGFEANARYHVYCLGRAHIDFLAGYRFLRLNENLAVNDQVAGIGANPLFLQGAMLPIGSTQSDRDSFSTTNQFSGLNFGARMRWEGDNFFVSAFTKAAFGCSNENVQINGITSATIPGSGTTTAQGGILALTSNIGDYSRNVFSIVPECGLNFGVDLTSHIRVTAGYSFLYWSEVARPGAEIDHGVNPTLVPGITSGVTSGSARPGFTFNESPFWVHTLMCGVEIHY